MAICDRRASSHSWGRKTVRGDGGEVGGGFAGKRRSVLRMGKGCSTIEEQEMAGIIP